MNDPKHRESHPLVDVAQGYEHPARRGEMKRNGGGGGSVAGNSERAESVRSVDVDWKLHYREKRRDSNLSVFEIRLPRFIAQLWSLVWDRIAWPLLLGPSFRFSRADDHFRGVFFRFVKGDPLRSLSRSKRSTHSKG